MESKLEVGAQQSRPVRRRLPQRRWFQVVGTLALLVCLAFIGIAEYVLHNAEPILRERIVETLSARFNLPVELDHVEISLFKGIEVEGYGLRIPLGAAAANPPSYPLLTVRHFAFRTSLRSLLRQPMHVAGVQVDGTEIHIPPTSRRAQLFGIRANPGDPRLRPKVAILVEELNCRDVNLFIESDRPNKDPLLFRIAAIDMRDVGAGQAMLYDARLTNPKPRGEIHAAGHFGPWGGSSAAVGQVADPGQTPLDGDYSFDHADMSSIRGLAGTLSSTGHFNGALDHLVVDGQTDIPDFSLDISNHPVPLHTDFHAVVDGTTGDTYLQPVHARLAGSEFTTTGKIVKVKGQGHDIQLDVDIPHGRMQDFLRVAVKTSLPLLNGVLSMRAKLHIPPGRERVPVKMTMIGAFHLGGAVFNNKRLQDRLDGLSARAQGHPEQVRQVSGDGHAEAGSQLGAKFTLGHGLLTVTDVQYAMPGATVLLNGIYSMDGRLFEFKGHVRTQATASEMVGGWKGMLLKPLVRLFQKNGAGVELPIQISGTEGDMQVGLALNGTDATPGQMLAEVRGKEHGKRELQAARDEAAQADREDAAAAKAPTLASAEQAHNAAVRHRAEAQSRALAAQHGGGSPHP